MLVRSGSRIRALHDRCSHRGCSLAEGDLDGDVIECGCHGSRFRLDDGAIERGPATTPQPVLDVREAGGSIEVRLAASPPLG
jgi:nitrite reductase/ring-hydroxylating ferredoxin subunit